MDSKMDMTFYFSSKFNLLFQSWNISSAGQLAGVLVGIFVVVLFYEGLKMSREVLLAVTLKRKGVMSAPKFTYPLLIIQQADKRPSPHPSHTSSNSGPRFAIVLIHLLQFGLRIVEVGLAYLLMLAVMTFNGWLFLTVVLGAAVGYFVSNLVKWSCLPLLG
ncbi:hypothetical protein EMCRGX_G020370 [Ephydatia muelleri]